MKESKFLQKVAKYGEVKICKKGIVFIFMIDNPNGINEEDTMSILGLIKEYSSEYSMVETARKEKTYFLIVKSKK